MTEQQPIFFPTHYRHSRSRRDGKPYVTIWFDDINTGKEKYTHIYSTCKNKKFWDEIIEKQHKDLFIGFDNLVYKDEKRGLIDADCVPTILEEHPKGTIKEVLREHYAVLAAERKPEPQVEPEGQFGKLFYFEAPK